MKGIIFVMLVILGCSKVNIKERDYYNEQKALRHGIVPVKPNVMEVRIKRSGEKDITKIGEQIFTRDCVRCHGVTGVGDGPDAKLQAHRPANLRQTVNLVQHFDFYLSISQMDKSMPGWNHPYTEEELRAIATYLKTFKQD